MCTQVIQASSVEVLSAGGTAVHVLSSLQRPETSTTYYVNHSRQAHMPGSGIAMRNSAWRTEQRSRFAPFCFVFGARNWRIHGLQSVGVGVKISFTWFDRDRVCVCVNHRVFSLICDKAVSTKDEPMTTQDGTVQLLASAQG